VAATNRPLESMVEQGTFRKDLFYRLNVARIHVPPLRDRLDDLPNLIRHYVRLLNEDFGTHIEGVDDDALERLLHHDWPGNVRELRNLLEATFVACPAPRIRALDLPEYLQPRSRGGVAATDERDRLISALVSVNWNKSRAAERLRWSRMTLYRKMAKYGVTDPTREEPDSAATA
jgi:transcriptional regulator of acetoin/glycerol metabolism